MVAAVCGGAVVDNKLFLAGGGGDHRLAGERWAALWSRCLVTASALNETSQYSEEAFSIEEGLIGRAYHKAFYTSKVTKINRRSNTVGPPVPVSGGLTVFQRPFSLVSSVAKFR